MTFLYCTRKRKINDVEMITKLMKGYYRHFIRDLPFFKIIYFFFWFLPTPHNFRELHFPFSNNVTSICFSGDIISIVPRFCVLLRDFYLMFSPLNETLPQNISVPFILALPLYFMGMGGWNNEMGFHKKKKGGL